MNATLLAAAVAAVIGGKTMADFPGEEIDISSAEGGRAKIYSFGARLESWIPQGGEEVFAMPKPYPQSWREGQIHGGIPLCWPWFVFEGPEGCRIHGLTGYFPWKVKARATDRVTLELDDTPETRRLWPHKFHAELEYAFAGDALTATFRAVNTGSEPFVCTEGFHPYFRVGDAGDCTVTGADGARYFWKGEAEKGDRRRWKGDFPCRLLGQGKPGFVFEEPSPRGVHVHSLIDPVLKRRLEISYEGNVKFVMWNSGPDFTQFGGADDPDFGKKFVCVEGGTLYRDRAYTLAPGETHTLKMTVRVKPHGLPGELLRKSCADPWLFRDGGVFYLTQTGSTKVIVEKSETLAGLSSPTCRRCLAYSAKKDPTLAALGYAGASGVWSPEIHPFTEEDFPGASGWYLFTALRDSAPGDSSRVKSIVLKSTTGRPDGPYGHPLTGAKFSSQLVLGKDGEPYPGWLVGQSVLRIASGKWKGVYSLFVTETGRGTASFRQEIRIVRLSKPWRMDSETGLVTTPTQPWEKIGAGPFTSDGTVKYHPAVVEGATAVYGDRGDIYLVYSGSGYWTNYGLGQLTWTGGDPLETSSWRKYEGNPVFSVADPQGLRRPGIDLQGAGHASFFTDETGRRLMVYHAYPFNSSDKEREIDGILLAPGCKAERRNAYLATYRIVYPGPDAKTGLFTAGNFSTPGAERRSGL